MKPRSLVLLSGGLDSVVNFRQAMIETEVLDILTFNYEQKAVAREIEATELIAEKFGVHHTILSLDWLAQMDTGLTRGNIPKFDECRLDDADYAGETAKAVWVPNRNGVMINVAAAYADSRKIDMIVVGFNREEGATFPDNTPEFVERVNAALEYSTLAKPKVTCWTLAMDKKEIVRLGIDNGAPFEYVWSCYHSGKEMCGECESCRRLKRALDQNAWFDEFQRRNRWKFKKG